jgi:hypothetical protein
MTMTTTDAGLRWPAALLCALTCLGGTSAAAQTTAPQTVQEILHFLVTNRGVQTSDFEKDQEAAEATRDTLTRTLLSSIATLPVATSASGFSYRLNPTLGTVERTSETFGPFFIERALTAGGGRASLGFTLHYASFRTLDGNALRDGSFVTIANQFPDEAEPFDVEALTLNISTRTATFFGNVGLSDRVDVGIAVPLVRLEIDGSRLNNYRGSTLLQARAEASTTGLADVAVRTKVRLTGEGPAAAAAGIEARLPTGREEDLLGAGELALRFLGVGSYEAGLASLYGNVAVGTGGLGREVSYGGAVAVAATPHFTIVGELMARRIAGIRRIGEVIAPHPRFRDVQTTRLMPVGDDQTSAVGVAGFKWNVGATWLLHASVLLPLTDAGLTARFTPTIALDYSFAR